MFHLAWQFSSSITKKDKMIDFAANITATVMHWGFGGVDLDWEFPNSKPDNASHITADRGNWCNTNSPEDFDNFISLIKVIISFLCTYRALMLTRVTGIEKTAHYCNEALGDYTSACSFSSFCSFFLDNC